MSHNPKKIWKLKGKPWKEREILGFSSGDDDEEDFGVTLASLRENAELGLPVPKPAPLPPGLLRFDDRGPGRDLQQEPATLPTGHLDFEDLGLGLRPELRQEAAPLPPATSMVKSNVQNTAKTNQEVDDEAWITDFFRPNKGNCIKDIIKENAQNQESLQSNCTLEAASDLDRDSMSLNTKVVDPMILETAGEVIMDKNPMGLETEEDAFGDWLPKKRKHVALSPIPEYWSREEHPKKERDDCLMEEDVNKSTGDVNKSRNWDVDHTMLIGPDEVKELEDWIIQERIDEPLSDIVEYDLLLSLAADYEKNYHILLKLLTPKSMFEDSAVEANKPDEASLFDKPAEKPEKPKQILKQVPTAGGLKIDKEKPILDNLAKEVKKPMPGAPTVKKFAEIPKQTPEQVPPAEMRIDSERPCTSKEALANSFKETLKPGPVVAMNVKKILPIPLEQQAKLKVAFPQLPRSVPPSAGVNLAREVNKPMPGTLAKRLAENPKQTAKKMPPAGIRIDGEKPSTSKEAKKTGPGQNIKKIQPVAVPLELPKPQVELPPLPRSIPAPPPSKDQPQKAVWLQVCSSIVAKQLEYLEAREKIEKKVKAGVPPETTESFAIIDEGITEYTKTQIKILAVKWLEQFGPESMNSLRRSVTIATTQNELDNPLFAKIRIMRRPTKREVLPVDLKYTNIFCTVETNIQMKLRDSVKGLNRALYKDGIDVIQHSFDNIRVSWIWSDGTVMILNGSSQSSLVNIQLKLIPLVGDLNYRTDVNLNIKYLRLTSHARYPWAIDLRKFSQAESLSEPIFGERHAYYVDKGKSGAVAKLYESGEVQVFAMSTDRADELLGRLYNVAVKYRVKKD